MISLRHAVTVTHRWTGLTIGLFAVVLAVTGGVLALRPMLDGVIYSRLQPPAACAEPQPLDRQVAAARAAHPKGTIAYTRIDPGTGAATMVRFADSDSIYVDPCTSTVLGTQGRWEGLFGRLEQLHRLAYWQNGPLNKLLKGITSLSLGFASIVGGLFLWWPRRRLGWRRALAVDLTLRRRAFVLNLHWVTGLYAGAIVLVVAATALPLAFDWAKQGLYTITGSRPSTVKFTSAAGGQPIPLETAWQALQAVMPAPASAVFHYPRKPGEPIEIYAVGRDAPHGEARSYLFLDAASGKPLGFQPYADLSRGRKLYYWMLAIHTGRAGGWLVDLILFAGMLAVPVMAYTGIDSYLRTRKRERAAKARV